MQINRLIGAHPLKSLMVKFLNAIQKVINLKLFKLAILKSYFVFFVNRFSESKHYWKKHRQYKLQAAKIIKNFIFFDFFWKNETFRLVGVLNFFCRNLLFQRFCWNMLKIFSKKFDPILFLYFQGFWKFYNNNKKNHNFVETCKNQKKISQHLSLKNCFILCIFNFYLKNIKLFFQRELLRLYFIVLIFISLKFINTLR